MPRNNSRPIALLLCLLTSFTTFSAAQTNSCTNHCGENLGVCLGFAVGNYVICGLDDDFCIPGYESDIETCVTAIESCNVSCPPPFIPPPDISTDVDQDRLPDLVAVKLYQTGSNKAEVHVMSAASGYQTFIQHLATSLAPITNVSQFAFAMADANPGFKPDFVAIKKTSTGTGKVEVHILSGDSNYQTLIIEIGTALSQLTDPNQFDFFMADVDGDRKPDLVAIKKYGTGSGKVEVHVLSGASNYQTFIQQIATGLAQLTDGNQFKFTMADIDKDGKPDLVAIKKYGTGTGTVEVHVLSAASNYQTFIQHLGSGLAVPADHNQFTYSMADVDQDGRFDLVAVKKYSTGTGDVEVHALSGSSNYQTFIQHSPTGLTQLSDGNQFVFLIN